MLPEGNEITRVVEEVLGKRWGHFPADGWKQSQLENDDGKEVFHSWKEFDCRQCGCVESGFPMWFLLLLVLNLRENPAQVSLCVETVVLLQ